MRLIADSQKRTKQQIGEETPARARAKLVRKLKSLERRGKLWLPFGRKLGLAGLALPDGSVTHNPKVMLGGLARHWGE
eukprot:110007-Pyramimonas_sp.AAC.1